MIKKIDNYEKKEVLDLYIHIKSNTKITAKNIPKITEKLVHTLFHNNKFEHIYYKKDTIDDTLKYLFIKDKYSHDQNKLNQQMINKNNSYINKLIKDEKDKIINKKNRNRTSWVATSSTKLDIS